MQTDLLKGKEPKVVHVRATDLDKFKQLMERGETFNGMDNKVVFIMAMIMGFRVGVRKVVDKQKYFFRTEYLKPEEKSLIKSIAVLETKGMGVLMNKKKVYSIAQEFAAGGISLLRNKVYDKSFGSYAKKLEEDLVKAYSSIKEMG